MDTNNHSIRNLLDKSGRGKPPVASDEVDPDSDAEYSAYAHGRISRLPQQSVIFRFADGSVRAFAYAYFYGVEGDDPTTGFTIDFSQHKVKVQGKNLETLFRLICQHRVAEVREAGRSRTFDGPDDIPLVSKIQVQDG
jgi:hypothetical protein